MDSPTGRLREVHENFISPRHIHSNEVSRVRVNLLLHGVTAIDAFANLAEFCCT
jgi:hypothetical protein